MLYVKGNKNYDKSFKSARDLTRTLEYNKRKVQIKEKALFNFTDGYYIYIFYKW